MQQAPGSGCAIGAGVLALLLLVSSSGCGPIEYVNQVTRKAATEVEAARAVDADKYAPYWYTLAVEYLHKAREEAAASDFQAANRFGRKSEAAAATARREALRLAADPKAFEREVGVPPEAEVVPAAVEEPRAGPGADGDDEVPDLLRSAP